MDYSSPHSGHSATRVLPHRRNTDPTRALESIYEFYEAHSHIFPRKSRELGADSQDDFEEVVGNFVDIAQATVRGLQTLGQVHPFLNAGVTVIVVVISMDIKRRENDRKIMALRMQMHDLLWVIFELGHVHHTRKGEKGGIDIVHRISGHLEKIGHDIQSCSSAIEAIAKKTFLAKSVKSAKYESRLADWSTKFQSHKRELELAFALHTSVGVDVANEKLDSLSKTLEGVQQHLREHEGKFRSVAMDLFRRLDTPREVDMQRFIQEHGGVVACLNNDQLLEEMIVKSGESFSRITGQDTARRSNNLPTIRRKLFKELTEDIDALFKENADQFNRKLQIHQKQLEAAIHSGTEHIAQILLSGSFDRIIDPDLQIIWKDMGWKGSVKARHFVLALHDYYTEKIHAIASDTTEVDRDSQTLTVPAESPPPTWTNGLSTPKRQDTGAWRRQNDRWALTYINAAYVQPILEAVDDDGTGFISIKEVNTFTSSRPNGWSLPHWIAYWAVGWQANVSIYKNKIYGLIRTMFQTLEHVLPSNKRAVDEYLFHRSFWRIELLLRSTHSVNPSLLEPDLMKTTEIYAAEEEEQLRSKLETMKYELHDQETVTLVTGEGRIERYVFPLLYLLLRRHLQVFTIGCKHVLDVEELVDMSESLVTILLLVDLRIQSLEAVFKQTHLDVQARLGNFAFGMFQLSYGDIKRVPKQNSFSAWVDEDGSNPLGKGPITLDEIDKQGAHIPLSILKYGIQDAFQSTNYGKFEPDRLRHTSHPIQGTWSGHCSRTHGSEIITYVVRISFRLSDDRRLLLGTGEDFQTASDMEGKISQTLLGYEFDVTVLQDTEGSKTTAVGTLDADRDIITMSWNDRRKIDNPDDPFYHPFQLRRIAPSLLRYRYTPQQFVEDPVRSRWTLACAAAEHQAREKLWSRCFFKARFDERRRFVELTTRSLIVTLGLTPQNPLMIAESGELDSLRRLLNPSEARFYHALAEFEIQKLPWHPAWGCDWCDHRITYSRMLCIQCMSDDLTDNIHLCATCADKTPSVRGFVHTVSHDMIKVEETLHDIHFAHVVEAARETAERVKGLLSSTESSPSGRNMSASQRMSRRTYSIHEAQTDSGPVCVCCNKVVAAPCYACVVCAQDTLICLDCESKRVPVPATGGSAPAHKRSHPLVLLRDSFRPGQQVTTEERLAILQQRLNVIEVKLTSGLAEIDAKVEERLTALENRVEERLTQLESASDRRFDVLESLMRQMVAQTFPAAYGQVSRDGAAML